MMHSLIIILLIYMNNTYTADDRQVTAYTQQVENSRQDVTSMQHEEHTIDKESTSTDIQTTLSVLPNFETSISQQINIAQQYYSAVKQSLKYDFLKHAGLITVCGTALNQGIIAISKFGIITRKPLDIPYIWTAPYIVGGLISLYGVHVFMGNKMSLILQHQKTLRTLQHSLQDLEEQIRPISKNNQKIQSLIENITTQLNEVKTVMPQLAKITGDNATLATIIKDFDKRLESINQAQVCLNHRITHSEQNIKLQESHLIIDDKRLADVEDVVSSQAQHTIQQAQNELADPNDLRDRAEALKAVSIACFGSRHVDTTIQEKDESIDKSIRDAQKPLLKKSKEKSGYQRPNGCFIQ